MTAARIRESVEHGRMGLPFCIHPVVAERFPGLRVVAVTAAGVHNGPPDERSQAWLDEAAVAAQALHPTGRAADHPHVAAWRAAYSSFGSKPSRYPSSVEALTARVLKGGALPAVDLLVDLSNAVSVRFGLPLGGEDVAHVAGREILQVAGGGEPFLERGTDEAEAVPAGEIVWADDEGVTCRRWNWRQCARTAITLETTDVAFVLERLPGLDLDVQDEAAAALAAGLAELGGDARIADVPLAPPC
jgi:DNA/RNA-binding domain of Phe-tRNA-synthetase-like protein